jgi:putative DNA methylase
MSIEEKFDIAFVAALALREKQIQQNYRPIIAVHKWFARRPGTLFRALILAEFGNDSLEDSFFCCNDFSGKCVADPFSGGGTPLLEANRVGCNVVGFDINPMATWIVREGIEHLDIERYEEASRRFIAELRVELDDLYLTDCPIYGDQDVPVKYFLWVKEVDCERCGARVSLFPGYLVAQSERHSSNVLVCADCGQLNEADDLQNPGHCRDCSKLLISAGPASRNRCACSSCGHVNRYPRPDSGPPRHRLFAIEYFNPKRKTGHQGRFFKKPDAKDFARCAKAEERWKAINEAYVPTEAIPAGDETNRLLRWGYKHYRELFNLRQLFALETSARRIARIEDARIRRALSTNLSDLLRYQNMLCRYDTMALKSLDVFSVHGFPVGLVQCESNFLGIVQERGGNVGSGGWTNIVEKYAKAKKYCHEPFEIRRQGTRSEVKFIRGEWIGEQRDGFPHRNVSIECKSSTEVELPPKSLDAVFTDPPYFGNVQYGELMDFCYVWLRRLARDEHIDFLRESTRAPEELTGNDTQGRGIVHFTEGISSIYARMARALKPGAPLAFTYHHNKLEAYAAIAVAILDAGLVCSASLPCPAEMSGSIHIHGTGSSIVDTIFVCRSAGTTANIGLVDGPSALIRLVGAELAELREAGMKPTAGDVRCIVHGHVARMAIWNLRSRWDAAMTTAMKLMRVRHAFAVFGNLDTVVDGALATKMSATRTGKLFAAIEVRNRGAHAVAF